jgi:hypothetical protein
VSVNCGRNTEREALTENGRQRWCIDELRRGGGSPTARGRQMASTRNEEPSECLERRNQAWGKEVGDECPTDFVSGGAKVMGRGGGSGWRPCGGKGGGGGPARQQWVVLRLGDCDPAAVEVRGGRRGVGSRGGLTCGP